MIVLAVRGIVRPSALICSHNIQRLAESVGANRVYVYAWRTLDAEKLVKILQTNITYVEASLEPEPKPQEILSRCWGRCKTMGQHHWRPENPYKQIMQTQNVLAMVDDNPWVVLTRPDLMVSPGKIEEWTKEDTYTMPEQCRYPIDSPVLANDQFAVGRKKVVLDAWSFGDAESMSVRFEGAENPEEVLGKHLQEKKIKTAIIRAAFYRLTRCS